VAVTATRVAHRCSTAIASGEGCGDEVVFVLLLAPASIRSGAKGPGLTARASASPPSHANRAGTTGTTRPKGTGPQRQRRARHRWAFGQHGPWNFRNSVDPRPSSAGCMRLFQTQSVGRGRTTSGFNVRSWSKAVIHQAIAWRRKPFCMGAAKRVDLQINVDLCCRGLVSLAHRIGGLRVEALRPRLLVGPFSSIAKT
jgi:hypothetical protein